VANQPLLPSTMNVTVPPGVLEEVTFAVRLTLPPDIELKGTFTFEALRTMDVGTGPPLPLVDPPPQPTKLRNNKMHEDRAALRAKRVLRSRDGIRKKSTSVSNEATGRGQKKRGEK